MTDRSGVDVTAAGYFEMFTPYNYADTKMVAMQEDPQQRPLCFKGYPRDHTSQSNDRT